jgi:hypothetical protein
MVLRWFNIRIPKQIGRCVVPAFTPPPTHFQDLPIARTPGSGEHLAFGQVAVAHDEAMTMFIVEVLVGFDVGSDFFLDGGLSMRRAPSRTISSRQIGRPQRFAVAGR